MATNDADTFLAGGAPAAKFQTPGDKCVGVILNYRLQQQTEFSPNKAVRGKLKFYDDGEPMMEVVFTLQTDDRDPGLEFDDGRRSIYARGKMLGAIKQAFRVAGANGNYTGGKLGVVFTGLGEPPSSAASAPKLYNAKFEPGQQADAELSTSHQDDEWDDGSEPF